MSVKGRKRVNFKVDADRRSRVAVAGTFNNWSPDKHVMKYKEGVFTLTTLLPKGRYEYKFVIDGQWCVDPRCREWTYNPYGSLNSVINVG
ncbi:MAG: isoamylase early set domain-containing protein [Lentisphaerae bacterium]|nr:isoamylase early set domain-containing protein [Lentisphaerota bacterium]